MSAKVVNAITGTTKTALESAYLTSPLTATQVGNTDFTFSMLGDSLVAVLGRIVRAYASVPGHPFRTYNTSQTANIANKGAIPSVNSASKPIVGVYGAIRNASTGEAMTEQPIQIIRTIVDDTDNRLKGTYDHYKIVDGRLYHTATNAIIDVCTFSASDELVAFAANGNATIPDACLDLAVSGLVASLMIDDEFVAQASIHGQYFENCLAEMRNGAASFAPAPVHQSSQQPVIS